MKTVVVSWWPCLSFLLLLLLLFVVVAVAFLVLVVVSAASSSSSCRIVVVPFIIATAAAALLRTERNHNLPSGTCSKSHKGRVIQTKGDGRMVRPYVHNPSVRTDSNHLTSPTTTFSHTEYAQHATVSSLIHTVLFRCYSYSSSVSFVILLLPPSLSAVR